MTEHVMRLRCLGGFGMLVAFGFFYFAMEEYALVSPSITMKECVPCISRRISIIKTPSPLRRTEEGCVWGSVGVIEAPGCLQ